MFLNINFKSVLVEEKGNLNVINVVFRGNEHAQLNIQMSATVGFWK